VILLPALSALLFAGAIALLLNLTPEQISDDILKMMSPKQSLRKQIKEAMGKKKKSLIAIEIRNIHNALVSTGKENMFTAVCVVSITLFVMGGVLAGLIGNLFLAPISAVAMALIPFVYAKSNLSYYDKHVKEELETALSIVTTSYMRNDNIVAAIRENLDYIKPPVRDIFKRFIAEATVINADIPLGLQHLRERIDNQIYYEWCDTLIACQNDRTQKNSLMPVAGKLTDVRLVNSELKTLLMEPRKEYWTMAAMVAGNIPLLYLINKDWFHTMLFSLPGKIVLALSAGVILVTAAFMFKYTKPIEYKR